MVVVTILVFLLGGCESDINDALTCSPCWEWVAGFCHAEGRYQQEQAIILQVLLAEYGDPGPLLKTGSPSPKASRENGSMQRGAGLSVRLLTHVLMPLNLTQVPTHMSARLAG